MVKINKNTIERKTHKLDASGEVMGRLAGKIAGLLMGKNKAIYLRNKDMGDYVIIENAEKILLTGNKFEQKKYKHYSNYPGGLKIENFKDAFKKNPGEVIKRAVFKMLPKNKLQKDRIKRLTFK